MNERQAVVPEMTLLIVDHWRLLRTLARLGDQLPDAPRGRIAAQVRFQQGRLDSVLAGLGLGLVTYEGRAFDGTLPPSAQNADDFADAGPLIIAETVEPTVVANGQILHSGKVNLAPEQTHVPRN